MFIVYIYAVYIFLWFTFIFIYRNWTALHCLHYSISSFYFYLQRCLWMLAPILPQQSHAALTGQCSAVWLLTGEGAAHRSTRQVRVRLNAMIQDLWLLWCCHVRLYHFWGWHSGGLCATPALHKGFACFPPPSCGLVSSRSPSACSLTYHQLKIARIVPLLCNGLACHAGCPLPWAPYAALDYPPPPLHDPILDNCWEIDGLMDGDCGLYSSS